MAEKEIKHAGSDRVKRSYFDKSRREEYTILIPDMLPIHFKLIMAIYKKYGYNMELLQNCSRNVIDEGLKNTHNDACYPALLVIGQFMDALKSGKYDLEHTALLMSQTGGGCRASNYIHLIRKALSTQFPEVPVLSLNFSGLEKDASIDITPAIAMKLIYAVLYGDMLMLLYKSMQALRDREKFYGRAFGKVAAQAWKAVRYTEQIYAHKEHLQCYAQRLCGAS